VCPKRRVPVIVPSRYFRALCFHRRGNGSEMVIKPGVSKSIADVRKRLRFLKLFLFRLFRLDVSLNLSLLRTHLIQV